MYLLDTDHIGIIQRGNEPECQRLLERMQAHQKTAFFVSIVSFQEQVSGWNAYVNRRGSAKHVVRAYAMFEQILADFVAMQVSAFEDAAATQFETLRQQRVRIGTMDLRIASSALVKGWTVLSRNLVDFHKVPGLSAEDWTSV